MKIKQLKKVLNSLPPEMDNARIIISSDSEGNSFNFLGDVGGETIFRDNEEEGVDYGYGGAIELFELDLTAEDQDLSEKEWSKLKKSKKNRAIILWPN
jgi:hypothetical protein